jgi:hypothetical protein
VFHSVNLDELYRLAYRADSDDYFRAALHNVDVRWAMLSRREKNANRETP